MKGRFGRPGKKYSSVVCTQWDRERKRDLFVWSLTKKNTNGGHFGGGAPTKITKSGFVNLRRC